MAGTLAHLLTAKRNVRPSLVDDAHLKAAAIALSSIQGCCGDGRSGHEEACAIGWAIHWCEYHAVILSRRPDQVAAVNVKMMDAHAKTLRRLAKE